MKKKLLTIILSCVLAFSATACGSSAGENSADNVTKKETETKTPIEEAIESTRTIGEINREAAAAEGSAELYEVPDEVPEIAAEVSETSDASEDYVANYIEGIGSDETATADSGAASDAASVFDDSATDDFLYALTGSTSTETVFQELPDNFTFDLPEEFAESEDGLYINSGSGNACIAWFVVPNDGSFSDTSEVVDFEPLVAEMEAEFYKSYGVAVDVSVLENGFCEINGKTGYTIALQYDMPDYGFSILQSFGMVETPDYIYGLFCMEAPGTDYYDEFKACINSMQIE